MRVSALLPYRRTQALFSIGKKANLPILSKNVFMKSSFDSLPWSLMKANTFLNIREAAPLAGTIFSTEPPEARYSSHILTLPAAASCDSTAMPWPGVAGASMSSQGKPLAIISSCSWSCSAVMPFFSSNSMSTFSSFIVL